MAASAFEIPYKVSDMAQDVKRSLMTRTLHRKSTLS